MQGWLWKRRDFLPGYRKRWVVVHNGKLSIYDSSVSPSDCPKASFELKGCFAAVEGLGQSWDGQPIFLFRVSFPFQGKKFFMGATTAEERTDWLSCIQSAVLKNHWVPSAASPLTRRKSSPSVMMSPASREKKGPYYTSVLLEEASILCRSRTVTPETEADAPADAGGAQSNGVSPSDLSQADTDSHAEASAGTSPDTDSGHLQPLTLFHAPARGTAKGAAGEEQALPHESGHVAWDVERCAGPAHTASEAVKDEGGAVDTVSPTRVQRSEEAVGKGVLGESMLSIDLATPDRTRVCDEAAQVSCRASPAVPGIPRRNMDLARIRTCALMALAAALLALAALRGPLARRVYWYVRERIARVACFLVLHPRLAERAQEPARGACVGVLRVLQSVSQRGGWGVVGVGIAASSLYSGSVALRQVGN